MKVIKSFQAVDRHGNTYIVEEREVQIKSSPLSGGKSRLAGSIEYWLADGGELIDEGSDADTWEIVNTGVIRRRVK